MGGRGEDACIEGRGKGEERRRPHPVCILKGKKGEMLEKWWMRQNGVPGKKWRRWSWVLVQFASQKHLLFPTFEATSLPLFLRSHFPGRKKVGLRKKERKKFAVRKSLCLASFLPASTPAQLCPARSIFINSEGTSEFFPKERKEEKLFSFFPFLKLSPHSSPFSLSQPPYSHQLDIPRSARCEPPSGRVSLSRRIKQFAHPT